VSSLFDIPAQLVMLLSLAASTAAHEPADTGVLARGAAPSTVAVVPLGGPMRFSEHAWLQALYENPGQSDGHAASIFLTTSGRYYVPTAADRTKVLDARNDAPLAAKVARAAAKRNAAVLQAALRRGPTVAELYIAHVLGPAPAIVLLKAADATPDMPLIEGFPGLAASLAESGDARSLTVGQFHRRLGEVLRGPPRLVAIGLKPSLDVAPRADTPWRANVEVAKAEGATQ
jgi:hypothetical protein